MNTAMRLQRLRPLAVPALLLAALEAYARTAGAGSDALAPPSAALAALGRAFVDRSLLEATAFTLAGAVLGLAIGAGLGLAAGMVLGLVPRAARACTPAIELLRPLPSVALIPLAMMVFGFGLWLEACIVAVATFWPLTILAQAAVRQVEPRWLEVAQVLGLSPWARVTQIVLPAIVPRLFTALRLGAGIALVVAVTVEIAANPHGLGYAMSLAQQSLDPALMLAWLGWIGVMGYAINAGLLRAERALRARMGDA